MVLVDVRRPSSHDAAAAALRAAGLLRPSQRITYLQASLPELAGLLNEALEQVKGPEQGTGQCTAGSGPQEEMGCKTRLQALQVQDTTSTHTNTGPALLTEEIAGSGPPQPASLGAVCEELAAAAASHSAGVIAVHACGSLTDRVLELAVAMRAPVAVMPCCYSGTARAAPLAARRALGVALAADLHRWV